MVLENVINITNFSYEIQNLKCSFQRKKKKRKYYKFQPQNSKSKHYFQPKEIAANFSYKIQNHRRYLNVSRNIIT